MEVEAEDEVRNGGNGRKGVWMPGKKEGRGGEGRKERRGGKKTKNTPSVISYLRPCNELIRF